MFFNLRFSRARMPGPQFGLAHVTSLLMALVVALAAVPASAEQQVYYRYLNEQGISVLDDRIPPQYAQKGYEIVSLSGEVLKTVPPAPDAEDLAAKQALLKLREDFQRLDRRYSSLADIERAKERKLANLDTNIAILRGNITGFEAQLVSLRSQAADVERAGRQVPDVLLQKLSDTRAELTAAEELLEVRLKELEDVAARFDQDLETYEKGSARFRSP